MGRLNNFSGLEYGKVHPTDIDCFMEFRDKLYIFAEAKYKDGRFPTGQRLALERVSKALQGGGRVATACVVRYDGLGDIMFAETIVDEYLWNGAWVAPSCQITLKMFTDGLLKAYVPEIIKETNED
jgi:hypothetical protein